MPKRPEISVILLFQGEAVRADFARNTSTPMLSVRESLDAEATFVDAINAVVGDQPRLAQRVIVLSTDVWAQLISLPRISIGGIESSELEAALRFEAETLSGIEIDDISIAYRPVGSIGDFDQFWVNVLRQSDLDSITAFLEKQGCREILLAHPVGFFGDPTEKLDGLAVEVWGELAFQLSHNGTQLSKVRQLGAELPDHCARVLIGSRGAVDLNSASPGQVLDLADADTLQRWLSRVAANYSERYDNLVAPVLRKSKPRRGTPVRHFVSAVLAIGVLGFCFWHYHYLKEQNRALAERIEEVKRPAIDKKRYEAEIVSILQSRAEVEAESDKLDEELTRIQFFLDNQDDRIAKLLKLLIELRRPDLFIQRIDGTEDGLSISGLSLSGESAQALAKQLRIEAQPLGWMVNPAKQKGQEKMTTGGPWNFSILLTDTGPFLKTGG